MQNIAARYFLKLKLNSCFDFLSFASFADDESKLGIEGKQSKFSCAVAVVGKKRCNISGARRKIFFGQLE